MQDYYSTAHRIKEKVVTQHSTMGGGDPTLLLKPYQVGFEILFKFEKAYARYNSLIGSFSDPWSRMDGLPLQQQSQRNPR